MNTTSYIMISFILYLLLMIGVGVFYAKRNQSTEDYFLGGRKLSGFMAAISAQASDMSGWLLMGLPGSIYALGTGQIWIAIGLFFGTVFNWMFISRRLRSYTIRANNAMTLPMYFENRFHDKKRILLFISSIIIVVFFLVYTASALAAGGKLFNSVFGMDYKVALTIGAVVILVYTFIGGFFAVCATDVIQGMLMLVGLLFVPILAWVLIGHGNIKDAIEASSVVGGADSYLNIMHNNGRNYTIVEIISQLAWGLGYCGMPHILVRFMAVKNEAELKKSKIVAISWVFLSLVFASAIGVIGRAFLPVVLEGNNSEKVFIELIREVFINHYSLAIVGGVFLCGILAAIMSTADSQLLVCASSVAEDMFKGIFNKQASDKTVLRVSRLTVVVIAVVAYVIALNPNNSIMGLVSNAWAGLGAAFGPIVLLSLYWKRTTLQGAVAGILSGAVTVIVWDYIPLLSGQTIGSSTGLYSLAIGFPISVVCIVIVSLLSQSPSDEIMEEFEDVRMNRVE